VSLFRDAAERMGFCSMVIIESIPQGKQLTLARKAASSSIRSKRLASWYCKHDRLQQAEGDGTEGDGAEGDGAEGDGAEG
jgi:hypothetical protein